MDEVIKKSNFDQKSAMKRSYSNKYGLSNFLIGTVMLLLLILVNVYVVFLFSFTMIESLIVALVSLIMYLILLYVLARTNYKRKILIKNGKDERKDIINAIVKEVGNAENKSSLDSEMPLDYKFVGSTKTKTYHLKECKIAQKIDKKFRLENNAESFFKKNKFKAHSCLKVKNESI